VPIELGIREFVNADEIARGLSPLNAEGAAITNGRLMLERMRDLVERGESFAFETTCSGRSHAAWLRNCKARGWRVMLLYLWLRSPEAAIARVKRRVQEGGHSVPAEIVVRRYWSGLRNMRSLYWPLADVAAIYENDDQARTLIAERTPSAPLVIHENRRWTTIERAATRPT
jgi:predicted ABC-type ATPase